MSSLAVVLIVKNEATMLAACLESVAWADEIIVLDSGSDDATVEIAKQYTDKVYVAEDWQGYGVQRQRAQAYAVSNWVLMIDADERVTPELKESIQDVISKNDPSSVWMVSRLPWCFGRFIRHGGWYPALTVRLYTRTKAGYGTERVHEKVHLDESLTVKRLKGDMLHYTYHDLEHYLQKSAYYAKEWATQKEREGKTATLLQGTGHGIGCFLKQYIFKAGFLDGKQGLLLAMLSAHSTFAKYADLWSRRQPGSSVE